MGSMRQVYYNLFSKIYDFVIRLHSSDREGSLRRFIAEQTLLPDGGRALDLCTGTGSVALELAKTVGEKGLVVGLDFSRGMIEKAKQKAAGLNLNHLQFVQGNASRLPFRSVSFDGVTCSHAFYELKGTERSKAIEEVARVLKEKGRFCLMEHAKPEKLTAKLLFYIRIFFLGASDVKKFLEKEEAVLGERFKNIGKEISPSGQSKLIYGEKGE
jgi:demethylmenaquinone methyltransferase/2-methoxy-6-polyprenyl-1,4-benzoquinol methylase